MKNYFNLSTIAALLVLGFMTPQAKADSVLFTLSTGGTASTSSGNGTVLTYNNGGFTLVLTGYSCSTSLCVNSETSTSTPDALFKGSAGVGLADDKQGTGLYEIPRNEFVQTDFSAIPAGSTITSIQFNMVDVIDGWDIYGSAKPGQFDSTSGGPLAQGDNQNHLSSAYLAMPNSSNTTLAAGATSGFSVITTGSMGYFNVTALQQDCETALASITVNYSSPGGQTQGSPNPEPGTCLLMGAGLLGLGVAGKKRLRRASKLRR